MVYRRACGTNRPKDIRSLPCREGRDTDRKVAGTGENPCPYRLLSFCRKKDEQPCSGKYLRLARKHSRAYFGKPAVHGLHGEWKIHDDHYKVHKVIENPKEEYQIIPNTQEAIIDENVWLRVQELRKNKRRPTKTNRKSLFSGLVFCADCKSKLHDSFYPGCSLGNDCEGSGCGFGGFCALL